VKALRFKVPNKAHRHALFMLIQKIMYGTKKRVRHPHPCGRVRLCLRAIEFPTLMRRSHPFARLFPALAWLTSRFPALPACSPQDESYAKDKVDELRDVWTDVEPVFVDYMETFWLGKACVCARVSRVCAGCACVWCRLRAA
jgi:hypothetical protein